MVKIEFERGFVKRSPWKEELLCWEPPCPHLQGKGECGVQDTEKELMGPLGELIHMSCSWDGVGQYKTHACKCRAAYGLRLWTMGGKSVAFPQMVGQSGVNPKEQTGSWTRYVSQRSF